MSRSSTAPTGRSLSKRHGSVTTDEFRAQGYLPEALVNYLALLGWSYDDKTTIMSRDELVERFSLERVSKSPAVFDYEKLTWMNGVYLRALPEQEYGDALLVWLRDQGYDWDEELVRRAVPLVQEKIALLSEFPGFAGFLFGPVEPEPAQLDGSGGAAGGGRRRRGGRRAIHGRGDRGGAAPARRRAGVEAARRVSADPHRRHRLEGLARPLREHRATGPRRGGEAALCLVASPAMAALDGKRIRHTVVFDLRHPHGSPEEADFLAAAERLAAIPDVEAFELLREVSPKNAYRFGISMEFADQVAYAAYNDHPDHVRFVDERWLPEVSDFLEVDYSAR